MPILTYDANGGTFAPPAETLDSGVASPITSDASEWDFDIVYNANGGTFYQGGYSRTDAVQVTTFNWSTTPDGSTEYSAGDSITITQDTTLYAVWPTNLATLLSLPYESDTSGNITERADYRLQPNQHWTYTQNSNDTVPTPWQVKANMIVNGAVTIYAKWQYRVNIHLDGGYSLAGPPYLVNSGATYIGAVPQNQVGQGIGSEAPLYRIQDPNHTPDMSPANRYYPKIGDVVLQCGEIIPQPTYHTIQAFYNNGSYWTTPQLNLTFTPAIGTVFDRNTTMDIDDSTAWLTSVLPGSELENLVVGLDYNSSGWTGVTLTLNSTNVTIPFQHRDDTSQTYTVIQGEVNLSTGQIFTESYTEVLTKPEDWEDGYSNYYIQESANVYVANQEEDWDQAITDYGHIYEQSTDPLLIPIQHIEVPDNSSSVLLSANTGGILGVQYYVTVADEGSILPDFGHLGELHLWKTHGITFTSPFTWVGNNILRPYGGASNLSKEDQCAIRFALSQERATLIGANPEIIDPDQDPAINFTYSTDAPIELYTAWTQQVYLLRFLLGYTPEGASSEVWREYFIRAGESPVIPDEPSRSGYTFTGWDGTWTDVHSDTDVTATWTADNSPIWIRENGGWTPYDPT